MKLTKILTYQFVEYIPRDIQEGIIYISMAFSTAIHKCCCGCGQEVVTPFGRTDWQLIFDGESISLDPSVGNWSFGCKSHYWIRHSKIIWASRWTKKQIERCRKRDELNKKEYYKEKGHKSLFDFLRRK